MSRTHRIFFIAQCLAGPNFGEFGKPEILEYTDEELNDFMSESKISMMVDDWVLVQKTWSGEDLGFYAWFYKDEGEERIADLSEQIKSTFHHGTPKRKWDRPLKIMAF